MNKKEKYILIFTILLFTSFLFWWRYNYENVLGGTKLPFDPKMTIDVLCAKGFTTKSVRPSVNITNEIKKEMLLEYVYSHIEPLGKDYKMSDYQLDHKIPLCLGGLPLSMDNLQIQPLEIAHEKDKVEKKLCSMICKGTIELNEARNILYSGKWKNYKDESLGGFIVDEDDF